MKPPDEVEALRGVREALVRGTRRSRLRILAVVCSRAGHTLLEVFPTPAGPVAVWRSHDRWQMKSDGNVVEVPPSERTGWWAKELPAPDIHATGQAGRVDTKCHCSEHTGVSLPWVAAQVLLK